ncbi:MAG: DUF4177 domain-containing protein [Akkermansiaceae bacterium]|nr:DUF4177 domain-containing protein [Akkermansiaceae bacterium]
MSEQFTYKYVRHKLIGGGWSGKFRTDYQDVIDEQARQGWRFVQAFAPAVVGYGASKYVDLIFEKRVS